MRFTVVLSLLFALAATGLRAGELGARGWDEPGGADVVKTAPGSPDAMLPLRPAALDAPQTTTDVPQLMLDTGGHMALIRSVAFTPDGRQLVSASDDKTIRVWDAAAGKTVRTIRGEIAPGDAGKIYAMALSPDGKWLAVGGYMGAFTGDMPLEDEEAHKIRLYDFASGRIVALLKGHENVVISLAFSPDSRHLISGSGDFSAILWDIGTRRARYRLRGHTDDVYAVGFTPDGERALTASYDHELRLWRTADGQLIARMIGHADKVRSLAIASDGTVVSGDKRGEIRLWDGKTGAFRKSLVRQGAAVGSLSFSPDGKLLLSGAASAPTDCHVYDVTSGREILTYRGHDNIVLATAISPDGRWAATAGGDDKEIHIWDLRKGTSRLGANGRPLRLRGVGMPIWATGFSTMDDRRIAWGNSNANPKGMTPANDRGPLEHVLALPSQEAVLTGPRPLRPSAVRAFRRAVPERDGWSLRTRKGGKYGFDAFLDIVHDGRLAASIERGPAEGYAHRAYSFTPDGETIISGGNNGWLTAYDRFGMKLGDFIGHQGVVWAVSPSPDGRYLLSGSADQTVRLWNLRTRELIATLFYTRNREWVIWMPQGYYAASASGSDMVGWQINHGPAHEAEYVTGAQLRKSLNRPDIVARAIELASAQSAVAEAPGTGFRVSDLGVRPVPSVHIASPEPNAVLRGGKTELQLELEPATVPVKLIRTQVNGRQIAEEMPKQGGGFKSGKIAFSVPLAKGRNIIRAVAVNETGETPAEVVVIHEGDGDLDKRGTLRILAVGVEKYPHIPGRDLPFPGADAKAFADAMTKHAGPLHKEVITRLLVNGADPAEAPTRANIMNALDMLRDSDENDTVMVFIAGHGVVEGPRYYLLPSDAELQSKNRVRLGTVVHWSALQEAVESTKGRRVVFLDTCHSGNAFNARLATDTSHQNIIVYSAARWDQQSFELSPLGHGLFTYALVEGVEGKADSDGDGLITTEQLRVFLAARVRELAPSQDQEPQYYAAPDVENYVLAQVGRSESTMNCGRFRFRCCRTEAHDCHRQVAAIANDRKARSRPPRQSLPVHVLYGRHTDTLPVRRR